MLKSNLASVFLLAAVLLGISAHARAAVTLELRPTSQVVMAGQTVEVALYAVADPDQPIGIIRVILSWDPNDLALKDPGWHGEGAYPWNPDAIGFPDGGPDPATGKAYFVAMVSSCVEHAMATSGGLKVTTFEFTAAANTGPTLVGLLDTHGLFATEVYNDLCNPQLVSLILAPDATVTITNCGSSGDCNDGNACTAETCTAGVCSYEPNFPVGFFCCDPATGDLTLLSDGNDCTKDQCDVDTGQVTHPYEQQGKLCDDESDTTCTDPDTCNGSGLCLPNHAQDGNFCVNNCTEGPDICVDGVCDGGGADPCPPIDPGYPFCQDRVVELDTCPNGDIDCDTASDFWCVDGVCTRPYACTECETTLDCPDSGHCYNFICFGNGSCLQVVLDSYCQDELLCNGEEHCEVDNFVGVCVDDLLPPCPDEDCREETCCIGEVCEEILCECVDCVVDTTCDDGDPCTGAETCDLIDFVCLPGTPVDCSYLDDDCNDGVCNPGTGECEAQVIDELIGLPGSCDDGEDCTLFDACTADGGCAGEAPSPDGPVDLGWSPVVPVVKGETFVVDFYLSSDVGSCSVSGSACSVSAQDCRNVCETGGMECDFVSDCPPGDFCMVTQDCLDSHRVSAVEAVIAWDPAVLELAPGSVPIDPCALTLQDALCRTCADTPYKRCTENPSQDCEFDSECAGVSNLCKPYCMCTDDSDCAWGGHRCYCPGGTPCSGATGVCVTGMYDWFGSAFPMGATDPDGLNDTWTDGNAKYMALAQPEVAKAALFADEPLWVTSIEFKAIAGSAGSDIEFIPCIGVWPTVTSVQGDGIGDITGNLVSVTVQVVECQVDGDCTDNVWCNGTERCVSQVCVPGSDPCPEQICIEAEQRCVDCEVDGDCEDGADCTTNTCVGETCVVEDLCPDDGLFCTGVEFCNVQLNMCDQTGDPCPPFCDEVNDTCPCAPPIVEALGPRYIAVTPQPVGNPVPVSYVVTSPDWPCLSKYVGGFMECGTSGERCQTDPDCNHCDGIAGACLTDDDCKLCTDNQTRCYTDQDCPGGYTCTIQYSCIISGNTCDLQAVRPIDVDADGQDDGIVATLVDDPQDATYLTPDEWGTALKRCAISFEACTDDNDCDVGVCSVTGIACSVVAQDCKTICQLAQTPCDVDAHCPPGDACTGVQDCEPYETCEPGRLYLTGEDILPSELVRVGEDSILVPTRYEIWADCGGLIDPVEVTMPAWSDVDRNGVVNFDDIQASIMAFEGRWPNRIPARTSVAVDIAGSTPCAVEQVVNLGDIQFIVMGFEGNHYNPDVLSEFDQCGTPCP